LFFAEIVVIEEKGAQLQVESGIAGIVMFLRAALDRAAK
jgi:hypothetical protein